MSTFTTYYKIPEGYSIIKEYYIGNINDAKKQVEILKKEFPNNKINRRNGSIFVLNKEK